MGDTFIDLVKSVCIFLIAGQSILHFGMGGGCEKYVRAVISFMVAAQLITGFFAITGKEGAFEMEYLIRTFEKDMEDMENNLETMEENLMERVEEASESFAMQGADPAAPIHDPGSDGFPRGTDALEDSSQTQIQIPRVEVTLE